MQKNSVRILSTRPLSAEIIGEASMHNIIIDQLSFIETKITGSKKIKDSIDKYLQQNITAVFTSMNAVDAVVKHFNQPPHWKIYCIGNTTKELVTDHFGKEAVSGTAINAEALADVIIKDNISHIVFFCGDQRREALPAKLHLHEVVTEELVVYNTIETPVLIEKKYDGILFFSPSAVQSFFSINKVTPDTQLFAIGSTTAKALQQYTRNSVVVPGSPGKKDIVKEVVGFYSKGM